MNPAVPPGTAPGSMRGKFCVVTGATSGIGRETAVGLAALGADVLLVGRDLARGEAAAAAARNEGHGEIAFFAADLSSQEELHRLAEQIRFGHPRVDVLVNNAGGTNPERRLTVDSIEWTFAVNHLAPFLLTTLLLDRLTESAARVVTVSSEAHRMLRTLDFDNLQGERRYKPLSAYAVSKLANVLFTYELARRLQGSGATATCLHPGVVRTGIWSETRGLLRLIVSLAKPFMLSPARSARAVVRLATDPAQATISGRYFNREEEERSSELSLDTALAARLWEVSETLTR